MFSQNRKFQLSGIEGTVSFSENSGLSAMLILKKTFKVRSAFCTPMHAGDRTFFASEFSLAGALSVPNHDPKVVEVSTFVTDGHVCACVQNI